MCYFEIIPPCEKDHKPEFRLGLHFGFLPKKVEGH